MTRVTQFQKELIALRDNSDWISLEMFQSLRELADQDDDPGFLNFALRNFCEESCPRCGAPGLYKWHFLGKLRHPDCWSWFVGVPAYMGEQISGVFRTGVELGGDMLAGDGKKEEGGGCIGGIIGFVMGVCFRLPFAVAMVPIQALFSWTQRRPRKDDAA